MENSYLEERFEMCISSVSDVVTGAWVREVKTLVKKYSFEMNKCRILLLLSLSFLF
jgi:hypothetical protein